MYPEDEEAGKSSQPDESVTTDSQSAESSDSSADSTPAEADTQTSMGDALKAEMERINDASQERLEGTPDDDSGEGSPTSEESGSDADSTQDQDRSGGGDEDEDAEKAKAEKAEKEWLQKQKPETARRFQELTGKLRTSNEERKQLQEQLQSQQADVQRLQQFNQWVNETAGFTSQQQWQEFLQTGALINNDPAAGLQALERYAATLREQLGLSGALPEDIQQRLDDGLLDEASARELANARRLRDVGDSTRRQQEQRRQARERQKAQQERTQSIANAVNDAEKAWRAKDPDYDALAADVQDKVIALLQKEGGSLKGPEDAVKLYERAVQSVKKLASLGSRQKREIQTVNSGAGGGNQAAGEKPPSTMVGAMRRAYDQARKTG